jgi:hypothetical protein
MQIIKSKPEDTVTTIKSETVLNSLPGASLEEYHSDQHRIKQLSKKKLNRGLYLIIWMLRIYVVFMLVVLALNVLNNMH